MVDRTHGETKLWESFIKGEKRRHLKKFIDAIIRYCIPMEFVW